MFVTEGIFRKEVGLELGLEEWIVLQGSRGGRGQQSLSFGKRVGHAKRRLLRM